MTDTRALGRSSDCALADDRRTEPGPWTPAIEAVVQGEYNKESRQAQGPAMKNLPLALGALLFLWSGWARAQFPNGQPTANPYQQPAVTPYLNLLRSGGTPALNYFGLVQPQQQFYRNSALLQNQISNNQQAINGLQYAPTTGHPVYFLNLGNHFLTTSPGGRSSGGMTPTSGVGQRTGTPMTGSPGASTSPAGPHSPAPAR